MELGANPRCIVTRELSEDASMAVGQRNQLYACGADKAREAVYRRPDLPDLAKSDFAGHPYDFIDAG